MISESQTPCHHPILIPPLDLISPPENYPWHDLTSEQLLVVKRLQEARPGLLATENILNGSNTSTQRQREQDWLTDITLIHYAKAAKFNYDQACNFY